MSIIRLKDQGIDGWKHAWQKYTHMKPFPTPGKYVRTTMLLALASNFSATTMHAIDGWMTEQGTGVQVEEIEEDEESDECDE